MDNYHFYEEIAKGKHSVVFKTRKKMSIDYFSVKSIDKCERKKLMNEVKLMHPLNHMNVLRFYNWYETKNHLWAIFEYASGGNLQSLMEKDKTLTEPQIQIFAKDLVQGLHYMHSKGVVYCDLKPQNVLLNEYGTLKFNDFGLAKSTVDLIQTEEDTKEGSKRGTLCYMAPELFQDDGMHSFQSDLWSLGCMLYEMGTGKAAFSGKSFNEQVQSILNSNVEQIPTFSKEFHSLLFGLLSKNPLHRPAWADIIMHPFFDWNPIQRKNLLSVQIPQQPHFDRWATAKYPPARSSSNNSKQQLQQQNVQSTNDGVNLLRLSMNVKNNQWRDKRREDEQQYAAGGGYALNTTKSQGKSQQEDGDFLLLNRNEIVDIGGTALAAITDRSGGTAVEEYNEFVYSTLPLEDKNNGSLGLIKQKSQTADVTGELQQLHQQQSQQQASSGKIQSYGSAISTAGSLYYPNSTVSPSSGLAKVSGTIANQNQQQVQQKVNLANRSRAHQEEGGRSRQNGSHTPSSPNQSNVSSGNLMRTPSQKVASAVAPNSIGRQTGTINNNNNNLYQLGSNQNSALLKTPSTPQTHNGSNAHAKSVSPYHSGSSSRVGQQTQQQNMNSNLRTNSSNNNTNNNGGYNGVLKNSTNVHNIASNVATTQLASPSGTPGMQGNSVMGSPYSNGSMYGQQSLQNSRVQMNQQGIYTNNSSSRQANGNMAGISPNRKNSTQIVNSNAIIGAGGHKSNLSVTQNTSKLDLSPSSLATNISTTATAALATTPATKIVLPFTLEPIEKLFLHASDSIAKPIIGHKDIEKQVVETSFKKEAIPFAIYSSEVVEKNLNSVEVQSLLEQIFSCLRAPTTSDKYNLLVYFESIIQNSTVANFLINSAFINMLLDLLTNVRVPLVRMRVATCIGFLLRFATQIENDLSKLQLPLIIAEVFTSEKDPKVCRKLMATMGEYLFYAATLVDDDPQNSVWRISPQIISFLVMKIGSFEEDELVRFYACKTLENITSSSITMGQSFCNQESIQALIALFLNSRNEDLKASAIVSLTHIGRLRNSLIEPIINGLGGVEKLCEILNRENAIHRTQQAVLTLINFQLSLFPSSEIAVLSMMRDSRFSSTIVSLLESSHTIIRGKAIICLYLCITHNPRCLIDICSTKFFVFIDKLAKDNFKYVQQCFQHLRLVSLNCLPWLIQAVKEDLIRIQKGEIAPQNTQMYHSSANRSAVPVLHGNLQFLHVLVSFAKCDQLKAMLLEVSRLEECFDLFELLVNPAEAILIEARSVLINLFEVILSNEQNVTDRFEFFARRVLPKLIDHFQFQLQFTPPKESQLYASMLTSNPSYQQLGGVGMGTGSSIATMSNDWKFTYLKLIQDIVLILAQETEKWNIAAASWLNEIFVNKFIGTIMPLLVNGTDDSIMLICLKLLHSLVDTSPGLYVSALRNRGMFGLLASQFNQTSTRSTLKLISRIVQASSLSEIQQFGILGKAITLFQHFVARQQEQCYEDILDILLYISSKIMQVQPLMSVEKPSYFDYVVDQQYEVLIIAYLVCYSLLSSNDYNLAEKASVFIIQVLYIFSKPMRLSGVLCKGEHFNVFVNSIANGFIGQSSVVQKRNLRVITWFTSVLSVPKEVRETVCSQLEKAANGCKDYKMNSIVRDVVFKLRSSANSYIQ